MTDRPSILDWLICEEVGVNESVHKKGAEKKTIQNYNERDGR